MPIVFVMQGKCLFSDISSPELYFTDGKSCCGDTRPAHSMTTVLNGIITHKNTTSVHYQLLV